MRLLGLAALLLLGGASSHGQGCTQCQDNMREMPARTQSAYRHAIELLAVAGVGVFTGGTWAMRRFR